MEAVLSNHKSLLLTFDLFMFVVFVNPLKSTYMSGRPQMVLVLLEHPKEIQQNFLTLCQHQNSIAIEAKLRGLHLVITW